MVLFITFQSWWKISEAINLQNQNLTWLIALEGLRHDWMNLFHKAYGDSWIAEEEYTLEKHAPMARKQENNE